MKSAITKTRIFAAVLGGNLIFVFFNAAIAWTLAFFNVTPYGRFVAAFFRGRTREEVAARIGSDRALFDSMLAEASSFANLFLTPVSGFVMGLFAGAMLAKNRRLAVIWSVLAALPLSLFFIMKSGGGHEKFLYLVLFIAVTALGGLAGSAFFVKATSKKKKETADVDL
ncbi:MAG: hypothetical protein H3C68_05675 [Deltaproteobacteria bacterium]|nr:hypothetical protein [Deltaproteobacteria bacterium]MBZ0220217.1 hypothetical protein [Deltaproteobacteria bacterium]